MICRVRTLKSGKEWIGYYYNGRDDQGKRVEIPLGSDINEAKRKWAELECQSAPAETGLMRYIFDRYEREIIPTKAPRTQKDNLAYLQFIRKVFDSAPIDLITPQHIAQYRDKRGQSAPVRANREISLLSHVWNMAREWGYTAKENPVKGVRKNKESPRDFYADDAVWNAVYQLASQELKDAMDMSYLTGQRPADVLKMRLTDIANGALEVKQNKTGKKLRILINNGTQRTELGKVIDRIRSRKVTSLFLIATPEGKQMTAAMLRLRFERARSEAIAAAIESGKESLANRVSDFQFKDIRPKAASEIDLVHASKLLGHTEQEITEKVYRRKGETVLPTK